MPTVISVTAVIRKARCIALPLFLGCLFFGFSRSRASQNIAQRVVGLVAGVFINRLIGRRPGIFAGPRLGPGGGIFDGETVEKCSAIHAREALDDVQIFSGSTKASLVGEIS